jgi:hypothetical protein
MNLAINARDAMPDGGELTISASARKLTASDLFDQEQASPGDYVEIVVADSGVGMAPDVLSRAVEPFFTTKPIGQGTGLGLSQVYGFVRQSGGFLRMESERGRGTRVGIYMPGSLWAQGGFKGRPKPAARLATPSSAHGAILLVEDQADVRSQIVEVLTDMGCEVTEAADGAEGLGRDWGSRIAVISTSW